MTYFILVIATLIWGIPLMLILRRLGFGWPIAVLALIPIFGMLTYLIIAFAKWPIPDASASRYDRRI